MSAERGIDAFPLVGRHVVAAVASVGNRRDLVAGDPTEAAHEPRDVEPRKPAVDDEPSRVVRMPDAVEQDDGGAHRMPIDDRPRDPERVAERAYVVGARLERPRRGICPVRTTVSA